MFAFIAVRWAFYQIHQPNKRNKPDKIYNSNFPHLARYFWCGNGAGYYAPPAGNQPHRTNTF